MAKWIWVEPSIVEVREYNGDWESVRDFIGGSFEVQQYPSQYKGGRFAVYLHGEGVYYATAYNRWGIVAPFVVEKHNVNGHPISLSAAEIKQILIDLEDRDGGYLSDDCKTMCPFREIFRKTGIPPAGWVPPAGRWFK